jgi:hypothetical protein
MKLLITMCLLTLSTLFSFGQNCPTNPCTNHTTVVALDSIPSCSKNGIQIVGNINNNSDCEDINGDNCYKWVLYKTPTSNISSIYVEIGQGNSCNGEVNNIYIESNQCIDIGSTVSQNSFTFNFNTSDTLFVWICNKYSGQVLICNLCTNKYLPVDLRYFVAIQNWNKHELYWVTEYEINNKGWHVMRSFDGINFEEIGFVKSVGNNYLRGEYSYKYDTNKNKIYYYRIDQENYDGSITKSDVEIIDNRYNVDEILRNGRYYNTQGIEVDSNARGELIVKYGGKSIKIFKR